jgi:hypothetical protein
MTDLYFFYAVPILFIKMADRSLLLYINYRAYYSITLKDKYLLLYMYYLLYGVHGCEHFIKLDLKAADYQIYLRDINRDKIAVITKYRLFE